MDKKAMLTDAVLKAVGFGAIIWQFVYYIIHMGSLPEEPGIHFAANGEFDVYASKIYGFYPHIITLIALAVDIVVTVVIAKGKLKLGLKVSENGSRLITSSIVVTLDLITLSVVGCFCCWVYAVSRQDQGIMGKYPGIILSIGIFAVLAGVIFQCAVSAVCREKTEDEKDFSPEEKRKRRIRFLLTGSSGNADKELSHRLSRIAGWLTVAVLTGIILFSLERLPSDDIADLHHGQAFFANFGDYYPKWLVFLPYIIAVPIMALCEIISVGANKKGRAALVTLCDRIKLLLAVFSSWWEMILVNEQPIGFVSVILFAVLCITDFIRYHFEKTAEQQ